MWQDRRTLGVGQITWEQFKIAFIERFFPSGKRENKVEEFINLKQRSVTIREYSLKFIKLSDMPLLLCRRTGRR